MEDTPKFPSKEIRIDEMLANEGLMLLNPVAHKGGPRTFLISGMARGGTSLLARLFSVAGIPIGASADPVVFEDRKVARALEMPTRTELRDLIARRNAKHEVWGFKRPNLFDHLAIEETDLFRKPSLVLIFRDPIAIAQRYVISNLSTVSRALTAAVQGLTKLMAFAQDARCPTLLVSYEKALALPGRLVDALASFAGWTLTESRRARLVETVTADNPMYWRTTRIRIRGFIDRLVGGRLDGWCQIEGSKSSVALQLLIDGTVAAEFRADRHRDDLALAGIGDGQHGFSCDLSKLTLRDDSVLAVQVKNRDFLLVNSGRSAGQLRKKP